MEVAAAAYFCASAYHYFCNYVTYHEQREEKPRRRRCWMIGMHRDRMKQNMDNMLIGLQREPSGEFQNFCRMSSTDFECLLQKIGPTISKENTNWRACIPAKIRLAVTLRFLATGESYRSLHFLFQMSSQIISKIIPEVCRALNEALKDQLQLPSTATEWLAKEEGFSSNFPHCIGAIDWKPITLQSTFNGSEYQNYKKMRIVLLALVDSNYRFMFADIVSQGKENDGSVFKHSSLSHKIFSNALDFPPPCPLPGTDKNLPYVFVADGAVALHSNIMKPFPGDQDAGSSKHIFNQRLSSARVVTENVFGIMSSVFSILKKPIALDIEKSSLATMTCILLHNFLRGSETSCDIYTPVGTMDSYVNGKLEHAGSWRSEQSKANPTSSIQQITQSAPTNAIQIRLDYADYFFKNKI